MLIRWLGNLTLAVGACAAIACSTAPEAEGEEAADEGALVDVVTPDESPEVLIKDPRTLLKLEDRLSLATMLGGKGPSTKDMHASSASYRAFAASVKSTVDQQLKEAGSGIGVNFNKRLFDPSWLQSSQVRFELTGVANRIDLKHKGGCGEVHLVYRLAYTTYTKPGVESSKVDSRLPMTVNLLAPIPDDGKACAKVAADWQALKSAPDVAAAALGGPLAKLNVSRLETNFQFIRMAARARRDMGGHAEYALRAFAVRPDGLEPVALDDTPRTNLDANERAELLGWIQNNLAAIDKGTAVVPQKFLATETVSIAPRAAARLGNKPFTQLFRPSDFASLPLASTERVKSPVALLHRLDGMTCNGCHQARGVAGFHVLGEERLGVARLNALAVGASPHVMEILPWRKQVLAAIASGSPVPGRPHADRVNESAGGTYGAHCTLGKDAGFADWKCGAGLTCKDVNDDTLGHCMAGADAPAHGDACEVTRVVASTNMSTEKADTRDLACGRGAVCSTSHGQDGKQDGGFPEGTCRAPCTKMGELSPDKSTICGGIPSGGGKYGGINKCLFELKMPFMVCLEDDARPSLIRACGANAPCRDDYVCARVLPKKNGVELPESDPSMGACMPPYFVFQGRVDGHVLARE